MRILVTGHDGYIGRVMAPVLLAAGHDVAGLDSGLFSGCHHGPPPLEIPSVTKDIRDVEADDLAGFDAVVHLAALSNDPLGDLQPHHTHEINHLASTRLAQLAKQVGVSRFLYSSSCSVYGASDADGLVDETAPMRPVTPYAVSKVNVEHDVFGLADDDFTVVSLRNATAYGWSPQLRLDLVVNDLVASAVLTGEVRVRSDGTPWRPLVHVKDIARAFLAVLDAPARSVSGQAFNVGDESGNHKVHELATIVAEIVDGSEVVITGEHGADPRTYRVDFSKLRRHVPGFRHEWSVRDGAAELLDAFRRHGLSPDAYERTYRRLAWLNGLRAQGRVDDTLRPTTTQDEPVPVSTEEGPR